MRLFLSSNRFGAYPEKLIEFFGEVEKVAVITNAKDYKNNEERDESVNEVLEFLSALGYSPVEIDLRNFFGKSEQLSEALSGYSNIWVSGGNTFILRKALKYSGGDEILTTKVKNGTLSYGGDSAAAVLVTPDFRGIELVDDPGIIPDKYKEAKINDGLGLIPYHLVPHYKSGMVGINETLKILKNAGLKYQTMTDEQVIIIDGDKEEFLK